MKVAIAGAGAMLPAGRRQGSLLLLGGGLGLVSLLVSGFAIGARGWAFDGLDGYLYIMGRTDDIINVAGHRLGTREIEESIASHPNVAEVAVVGVADALKGQVAMAFAVLKAADAARTPEAMQALQADILRTVDEHIGAVGRPARVVFVNALPKTRSGKLLRRAIQAICEGRATGDLTTIEDPATLQQLQQAWQAITRPN